MQKTTMTLPHVADLDIQMILVPVDFPSRADFVHRLSLLHNENKPRSTKDSQRCNTQTDD
jgi:hypothetical protein